MELKEYQRTALDELSLFWAFFNARNEGAPLSGVWRDYWSERGFNVCETEGDRAVPRYVDFLPNVPRVCLKIPTGGGKTFVACAALERIFGDARAFGAPRFVVWLVPSDAILEQTIRTLSNPFHPYRARLDSDFGGRVVVLTKEQLLSGQNFSPDSVCETTTIGVLSYASLRIDSNKKDARKVFQENGALYRFELEAARFGSTFDAPPLDADETSLIQTIRRLRPLVVVDESHNATSDLSVEMLKNLNPSAVLELSATPRVQTNVVSYVDALKLKREHMVKLPVIVRRFDSKDEVVENAIRLQKRLEDAAQAETNDEGAPYLRPIVLFQAQPNKGENAETFERIRASLEESGVPKERIAIKTSEINDLKGVDLSSPDCPIQYIITVNALREGWDCPFAYILASLANKTSEVDVEQILGRVLRLPQTRRRTNPLLNDSFVFTSSNDFNATVEKIVAGLNKAGFSRDCVRVAGAPQPSENAEVPTTGFLFEPNPPTSDVENVAETDADALNPERLKVALSRVENAAAAERFAEFERAVARETTAFEQSAQEVETNGFIGGDLAKMTKQFAVAAEFADEIEATRLPQFFFKETPTLFIDRNDAEFLPPASTENLTEGFSLEGVDSDVDFELAQNEARAIDVDANSVVKIGAVSQTDAANLRRYLTTLSSAEKVDYCKAELRRLLNKKYNVLAGKEIRDYVDRVVSKMGPDVLEKAPTEIVRYAAQIEKKIDAKIVDYCRGQFESLLDAGEIVVRPSFRFPKSVAPKTPNTSFAKTLYGAVDGALNELEKEVLFQIGALENVAWIHRNEERGETNFHLNGFINHYPDFIVKTNAGTIALVETKGEHLANQDSVDKLTLGRRWQETAGRDFRYFMVFKDNGLQIPGSYVVEEFIEILKKL